MVNFWILNLVTNPNYMIPHHYLQMMRLARCTVESKGQIDCMFALRHFCLLSYYYWGYSAIAIFNAGEFQTWKCWLFLTQFSVLTWCTASFKTTSVGLDARFVKLIFLLSPACYQKNWLHFYHCAIYRVSQEIQYIAPSFIILHTL